MSAREWPPLTVVVPNYNGAAHLEPCFASLLALDYPPDRLDLLLVDNGSTDDSLALMRRRFPQVRVLRNATNLGFAAPCNQGVGAARTPLVALLNNDARVDAGWARALVAPLLDRPEVAAVGAKMLDWTGERIDFAGGLLNFYGHAFQYLYGAPSSADTSLAERPTLFACGGAMVVRRDVFLACGGFDESYFAFFEDVDLGWRLWVLGHEVLLAPRAIAYHRGHATGSRIPAHQRRVLYERNALYTIIKNYEAATLERVLPAALLLAAQRGLMHGQVETAPYVLGRDGGGPTEQVARLAVSHFLALGEVGLKLDDVWARRAAVQQARRRPDAAILPLFGEPFMPNHVDPLYLATQERVVRTFGIDRLFAPPGQESASPTAPLTAGPRGHPSEAERVESATGPATGAAPRQTDDRPATVPTPVAAAAPGRARWRRWGALRRPQRSPRPPGAVAVITYVTRPTPWWRLPLRAWHFLRLGGPRRLQREVGNYVRWLRARH